MIRITIAAAAAAIGAVGTYTYINGRPEDLSAAGLLKKAEHRRQLLEIRGDRKDSEAVDAYLLGRHIIDVDPRSGVTLLSHALENGIRPAHLPLAQHYRQKYLEGRGLLLYAPDGFAKPTAEEIQDNAVRSLAHFAELVRDGDAEGSYGVGELNVLHCTSSGFASKKIVKTSEGASVSMDGTIKDECKTVIHEKGEEIEEHLAKAIESESIERSSPPILTRRQSTVIQRVNTYWVRCTPTSRASCPATAPIMRKRCVCGRAVPPRVTRTACEHSRKRMVLARSRGEMPKRHQRGGKRRDNDMRYHITPSSTTMFISINSN